MPHLSPSINRGRSPSSNNGCGTNTGNGSSERTHHLLHHSVVASANNTGADLNLIYNVKPRSSSSTTNQDGGRSLPRPARKNYHHQRSPSGAGTNGTINSGWRSRSSEAANGGGRSQFMSRSYAAPTISSRTHQQMQQQQQQRQRGQLSRSHEERALRSISVGRQSLTASKNSLNNQSIQQQQQPQQPPPPPSYSSNPPVIQSTLSNSITSSSGSRNALAASITQQVK